MSSATENVQNVTQKIAKPSSNKIPKRIYNPEPGYPIGIVSAQSIGQPTTQMALSSFHHIGGNAKNVKGVTEGISRMKEIMNLSFKNSKSSCDIVLKKPIDPIDIVNAKIASLIKYYYIEEDLDSWWYDIAEKTGFYKKPLKKVEKLVFRIVFDIEKIHRMRISLKRIASAINENISEDKKRMIRLMLSPEYLGIVDIGSSEGCFRKDIHIELYKLFKEIHSINLFSSGINDVFIDGLNATTVGSDLKTVLGLEDVDSENTTSNSSRDVYNNLGIEAARMSLVIEFSKVLKGKIDYSNPHINLIADFITSTGDLVPINSAGVSHQNLGCLTKASYERTMKELASASCIGQIDILDGVSENIIVGSRTEIGTGIMEIFDNSQDKNENDVDTI
jgi:DNA-directed RNA polymerase subunit A"